MEKTFAKFCKVKLYSIKKNVMRPIGGGEQGQVGMPLIKLNLYKRLSQFPIKGVTAQQVRTP